MKGVLKMKKAFFAKAGQMELKDVEKPAVKAEDDLILKDVRPCVCG